MHLKLQGKSRFKGGKPLSFPLIALGLALVSGCAHSPSRSSDSDSPHTVSDVITDAAPPTVYRNNQGEIYVRGIKLQNTQFDFPVAINSRVEYWVDYFTGKGRKYFEKYLERSELFIPYITPILKQRNMPEDLVYLAMIESGFNNHARSHARAVGPWQFISATGKRYGLMVNWWVDERRDTRKSTLAAVEYLGTLYQIFQSWELAAAAYNSGEAKIARAVRRFGTKDFWEISRHRFLRQETRDYVPKIIAAALIAKNRTQFGFPASSIQPGSGEVVAGDGEVVKVEKESEAQQPSPPTPGETLASVLQSDEYDDYEDGPSEEEATVTPALETVRGEPAPAVSETPPPLAKPIPVPQITKKGEMVGEEVTEFEVQSPADLLKIARAAGLSYQTIKSMNPEILRWCTPPTVSTYRIKLPASSKEKFLAEYNHAAFPRKVQFLTYRVRRGETISHIARHFGIRVDPLTDLNGISPRLTLRSGAKILLPLPNDRTRSLASLEIRDPPERHRRHLRRRRHGPKYYRVTYKRRESARARRVVENNS